MQIKRQQKWSRIIYGTSALGNLYTALDRKTKLQIVSECMQHSPTPVIFDSAGKYGAGLALQKLGEMLTKLNVSPESVLISNKLGWKQVPLTGTEPTFEKGVWMNIQHDAIQDISYDGILSCYEQGNRLLGGIYKPQLVSVHDPDEYLAAAISTDDRQHRLEDIKEAYKALHVLKESGEVQSVGVGAKNWKVIREIDSITSLDWVMFANSMTIYQHPFELLEFMEQLNKRGVKIINSAVFHAGFIIGGDYFDYELIKPEDAAYRQLFDWRTRFLTVCEDFSVNPAHACIQFALSAPGVQSIALNTSKPSHVKRNVEAVYGDLAPDFWRALKSEELINIDYPYL